MISIKQLFIYPIKSLSGISINTMEFDDLGPRNDRRYMLIDNEGIMLTQREHPLLARFKTSLINGDLLIEHHCDQIRIPLDQTSNNKLTSEVWSDQVNGFEVSEASSLWFSQKLNMKVHLIKIDPLAPRIMDKSFVKTNKQVGFADGFQVLITQQSSLEALNLEENEDMLRFRPNIVIEGAPAYAEDFWRTIKINQTVLDIVKPCARCSMPAVNPIDASKQPQVIRKLAQTRLTNKEMYFGQNAVISEGGNHTITLKDAISIIKQSKTSNIS